MIERIPHGVRDGLRKRQKLLVVWGITRAKTLGDTIGAHGAPFVMIAPQPDRSQIRESLVVCDLLRWKVAVIVVDRLRGCVPGVELTGRIILQKEAVGDEGLGWHGFYGVFSCGEFVRRMSLNFLSTERVKVFTET
jgi:hypothetical protein